MPETKQQKFWKSDFGIEYTNRSILVPEEVDARYLEVNGVKRSDVNRRFLQKLSVNSILEVGCNVGNLLRMLKQNGYNNLTGIDIQPYAVEKARELAPDIAFIEGSALDLPFPDKSFDLVYTSGLLIHISPDDIKTALSETYRVSKKYIWCYESYADSYQEIEYRGNRDCLWKANFAGMYLEMFPALNLVKKETFLYKGDEDKIDVVFLLEKEDPR